MSRWGIFVTGLLLAAAGCATQKESHTARTGIEQLLVSSAVDRSLDQIDFTPVRRRRVFLDTKYLDCVDKNYVVVSLRDRLMRQGTHMVEKPESAEVVMEVASGGVGTDAEELFVGVPEIPLPPPSPIAIPKMSLFTRKRMNGTAKLLVLAYDAKSRAPLVQSGTALARSDHNKWNVLGTGTITTGSVPRQIADATGELDFNVISASNVARRAFAPAREPEAPKALTPPRELEVQQAVHKEVALTPPPGTTPPE